jgi:hypothetical protein
MIGAAIGGAIFGFVEKSFPTLPTLPILGRAGTIALGAYVLGRNTHMGGGILRDVALAAAAVAGHELGGTGKISGDYPPEMGLHGIASQI